MLLIFQRTQTKCALKLLRRLRKQGIISQKSVKIYPTNNAISLVNLVLGLEDG